MQRSLLLISVGILVGVFATNVFGLLKHDEHDSRHPYKNLIEEQGAYKFTQKVLVWDADQTIETTDLFVSKIQKAIESYIHSEKQKGTISDVSVYFRDLNNGPWFQVDGEGLYLPASIYKIPLAIMVYHKAERDPSILDREIMITSTSSSKKIPFINPPEILENGKTYTVAKLVWHLLAYSDNEAIPPLRDFVNANTLQEFYTDLGIGQEGQSNLSAREIARFFRILYNASYLNRDHSEQLLAIMEKSSFVDGLKGGVPGSVPVSHKFGESGTLGLGVQQEFHDCGIIYAKIPYILCVMTRGPNISNLPSVISHISSIAYKFVSEERP